MALPTLPHPDMDFTPLDVLTAEEMNQLVANDQYLANYCKGLADGTNLNDSMILALTKKIFPVGSIIETYNSVNPSTYLGGTWERFGNGQTTVGVNGSDSDFNEAGKTGGAKTITLTTDQMPRHTHNILHLGSVSGNANGWIGSTGQTSGVQSGSAGGGQPHNNMPPYITVYRWRRTA